MNFQLDPFGRLNSVDVRETLRMLEEWAATAGKSDVEAMDTAITKLLGIEQRYPAFNRSYPADFVAGDNYRATMPDLQNGSSSSIRGAKRQIQHVGISNFRLPIKFQTREGDKLTLEM